MYKGLVYAKQSQKQKKTNKNIARLKYSCHFKKKKKDYKKFGTSLSEEMGLKFVKTISSDPVCTKD